MTNKAKLFWEKFGFKYSHKAENHNFFFGKTGEYTEYFTYPDSSCGTLPEYTLENLFKYCEEKILAKMVKQGVSNRDRARFVLFMVWLSGIKSGLSHTEALKKAIEEVING
jgi:hypothetical protein